MDLPHIDKSLAFCPEIILLKIFYHFLFVFILSIDPFINSHSNNNQLLEKFHHISEHKTWNYLKKKISYRLLLIACVQKLLMNMLDRDTFSGLENYLGGL